MSRILLIEDNPISRRIARAILVQAQYTVIEAPDGRTAITMIKVEVPDLILQDMMLPDMDGVDLTHRIRTIPGCADIPVIMLSGIGNRLVDARSIAARYSAWLVKPVDSYHLLEAVRTYLPRDESDDVGKGVRLLIVDDDPVQLKLARLHFMQLGFSVLTAGSATFALEQLRTKPVDAVLSDVLMPDIDGFELCLDIRKNPKFARIPVILITSYYQQDRDRNLALKCGASAFLQRGARFEGVHRTILDSIKLGPSASTPEAAAEHEELDLEHARSTRRQLDQQLKMNLTLARRCSAQATQLSLLGGIADALSRDMDIGVVLGDVLGAALDASAISRGILYLNKDDKQVVACSIGYPAAQQELVGSFFGHRAVLDSALAQGEPLTIAGDHASAEHAEILERAGSSSLFVVPLEDQQTKIGALVLASAITDVTTEQPAIFARAIGAHIVKSLQLKNAFDRIAFTDARYLGLVENSGSAIITATPDGVILNVNPMGEQIFGRPRTELIGHKMADFIATADREYAQLRIRSQKSGGTTGTEMGIMRPDHAAMTIRISSLLVEAGGQRVVLTIATDVTENNRLRQQAALNDKLAAVGALAAGIAHEINNPAAFIFNNLQQLGQQLGDLRGVVQKLRDLRQEPDPQRQLALLKDLATADLDIDGFLVDSHEIVRESIGGVERIRDIVRGMKGFARVEDSELAMFDINQTVETAINLTTHEIREKAVMKTELAAELPQVYGSRGKLQQVIINLVINAAQAIEGGEASANRIVVRSWKDGEWIRIDVTDTGKGIPPENLTRIFDPFFTTKPVGVGTGLGLSICYEIVRNHGGELRVENTAAGGACFSVLLPVPQGTAQVDPGRPVSASGPALRRLRILMIDDEHALLKSFQRLLRRSHEVVIAIGGRAGMEAIRSSRTPYDAIVCDLSMPDVNGIDLHRYIAETFPGMERSIVFMTGGAFTTQAVEFLETIDNPRIQKPFSREDFDRAVQTIVEKHGT